VLKWVVLGEPWRRLRRWSAPAGELSAVAADGAVRAYAEAVLHLLARCEALHHRWVEQLEEQRRSDRLANAAAVYRWYLNHLQEALARLEAPPPLASSHAALAAALAAAYRATQLLSQGYRFHNVRRICDGGVLLEDARAQGQAIRQLLETLVSGSPTVEAGGEASA
jgi:hypothetical protein